MSEHKWYPHPTNKTTDMACSLPGKKLFHPNSHFIKTQEWLRSVQTSVILGKCISENGFHQKQKQLLRSFLKMVFPKDQKTSPTPTPKKTQNISENVFAQNQRVLEQFRQCFPQNQKWLKSFQKMCFPKTKKKKLRAFQNFVVTPAQNPTRLIAFQKQIATPKPKRLRSLQKIISPQNQKRHTPKPKTT